LITGCSSGLGRELAVRLARAGRVVIATMRDLRRSDGLSALAAAEGLALDVCELDVLDQASVDAAVAEATRRHGGVDVLVNNAGVELKGPVEETDADQFSWQLETNVIGTFRVTKALLPQLRARGAGKIVFVSSVLGLAGRPFSGCYAASKFAIEGLAESLHFEMAPHGVSVTVMEPGRFPSDLGRNQRVARGSAPDAGYREHARAFAATLHRLEPAGYDPDPADFAAAVDRVIDDPAPPLRVPVGADTDRVVSLLGRRTFEEYAADLARLLGTPTEEGKQ
jgi:NAD(P)-dependent dehydrogenase (short-subunit alcohol dehydrogenase family)